MSSEGMQLFVFIYISAASQKLNQSSLALEKGSFSPSSSPCSSEGVKWHQEQISDKAAECSTPSAQPGGPKGMAPGPESCFLWLLAWLRFFLQAGTIRVDSLKQGNNDFKNSFKEIESKHLVKLAGRGKEGDLVWSRGTREDDGGNKGKKWQN